MLGGVDYQIWSELSILQALSVCHDIKHVQMSKVYSYRKLDLCELLLDLTSSPYQWPSISTQLTRKGIVVECYWAGTRSIMPNLDCSIHVCRMILCTY